VLFDALAYDFVEDDLEAYGDAASLEIVIVSLSDFFDLGILLAPLVRTLLRHAIKLLSK